MPQKVKKAHDIAEKIEVKSEEVAEEVLEAIDVTTEKVVEEVKANRFVPAALKKLPIRRLGIVSLIGIAVIGTSASVYFYNRSQAQNDVLGTQQAQIEEVKNLVEEVSKLIELPPEEPNIATVSDVEKLKSQPFFASAQNGDKVLIYQNTKKVYLYRPSTKKLIDVAIVNLGAAPTANNEGKTLVETDDVTPTPVEEKVITITILNGTTTTGLTKLGEASLGGLENFEVKERDNAVKRDYEKSVVVNIGSVNEERVMEIAKALQAEIEDLPEGEASPDADILVILGSEFAQNSSQE